jgi:hypothetical protein
MIPVPSTIMLFFNRHLCGGKGTFLYLSCVNKVTWSRIGCQMRAWGLAFVYLVLNRMVARKAIVKIGSPRQGHQDPERYKGRISLGIVDHRLSPCLLPRVAYSPLASV